MRHLLLLSFTLMLVASACRSPGSKPSNPAPPRQKVAPVQGLHGKVVRTNDKLRFVVLEFANSLLPGDQQRLNVYRNGQKVGELKVTGNPMNQNVAADILAGEAAVGDEVRPE